MRRRELREKLNISPLEPSPLWPASSFDPAAVSDIDFWQAASLSLSEGASVSAWAGDNGDYSYDQAMVSKRPTFKEDVDGYAAVRFATDDALGGGSTLAGLFEDGASFGMVVGVRNASTAGTTEAVWSVGNGSNNNPYISFWWPSSDDLYLRSHNDAGADFYDAAFAVADVNSSGVVIINYGGAGSTLDIWRDGTKIVDAASIASAGTQTLNRITLGALGRSSEITYLNADIHFHGLKSTPYTDDEVSSIFAWATSTYGL